ncbi:MAG: beta-mannosidase, partial [Cryptosporangiaceae bacterium]|nr:beta-mannosidase [Cryptosporangiaceae bacterium]
DLLAAGLIEDPYLDTNEATLGWIGRTAWRYATTFSWTPVDGRHDLVCEGLDTLAAVELNGALLGRTANQHRPHRFDVTTELRSGSNELVITFASALDHIEASADPRPHVNTHPYNAIRKMACNFGWDWGPDLVTAGIWRPIGIESWHTGRLGAVRPLVTAASAESGTVTFEVDVDGSPDHLTVRVGATEVTVPVTGGRCSVPVTVESPALWWPRGYGGQPRYDAEVTLWAGGDALDRWTGRIGFRTAEIDTAGGAFTIRINGEDVFVRGANWIPDDAFPSRVDRARYARRITDATDANINLLRVWGGGIYESGDFYDLCDERGIMVWQDFLFACAAYAEEGLAAEVEAEARAAVTRLSPHPSLILWNGNNENLWGYEDWGWREQLGSLSWGGGFYHDLLPRIVAELDPTRPYIPGSPYSPDPGAHPNDPSTGLVHIWDVWNTEDYRRYGDYTPRFVAEFGFQGPPNYSTLTSAIRDTGLGSPAMLAHQKAEDGTGKLERGWQGHFPDPQGTDPQRLDDWHWTTQLNQARAITFAIERFRALAPYCRGTILWQLNDCWPVVSWAAVDGSGRRKPLWYALRRAYADRLVTIQPRDGGLAAVLVNDSADPWRGELRIRRLLFGGTELAAQDARVTVPPRGILAVPLDPAVSAPRDPSGELIRAQTGAGQRATHFFAEDVGLALPRPEFTGSARPTPTGYTVEVIARTLLRDLTLGVDRIDPDAVVDDQLVTLLPGERATFAVTSLRELGEAALLGYPVFRTANDLLTGRPPTCSST